MSRAKRLIIANWKMHPGTLTDARKLFRGVSRKVTRIRKSTVVICPPTLYLSDLVSGYGGTTVSFGAQDCSTERTGGSFTGETSPLMLKRLGVQYAIVGHSERRARGETNELIAQKVKAAVTTGLTAVLCVGEEERDTEGTFLKWLEKEVQKSLEGVTRKDTGKLIVAYEPIWAIGKSAANAMTPEEVQHMYLFIRKVLVKKYGRKYGSKIKILYGGSIEPSNSTALLEEGGVDGFLVGHASLDSDDFAAIAK